jgi:hypothetical protein
MATVISHIAFLSMLVFIYPIAFMSFHVLHDHIPEDACLHSCCGHEDHPDSNDKQKTTIVDENTQCLICEYEFSKTETTHIQLTFKKSYTTQTFCEGGCSPAFIAFTGTNKSLRAPPVIA